MVWDRGPNFIFSHVDLQLPQHHLLKRLFFPHWEFLAPLSSRNIVLNHKSEHLDFLDNPKLSWKWTIQCFYQKWCTIHNVDSGIGSMESEPTKIWNVYTCCLLCGSIRSWIENSCSWSSRGGGWGCWAICWRAGFPMSHLKGSLKIASNSARQHWAICQIRWL